MDFHYSSRTKELLARLHAFTEHHIRPNLRTYEEQCATAPHWPVPPIVEELKVQARAAGLWNLFMPPWHGAEHVDETFVFDGPGLTNLEYAPLAEARSEEHTSELQ